MAGRPLHQGRDRKGQVLLRGNGVWWGAVQGGLVDPSGECILFGIYIELKDWCMSVCSCVLLVRNPSVCILYYLQVKTWYVIISGFMSWYPVWLVSLVFAFRHDVWWYILELHFIIGEIFLSVYKWGFLVPLSMIWSVVICENFIFTAKDLLQYLCVVMHLGFLFCLSPFFLSDASYILFLVLYSSGTREITH